MVPYSRGGGGGGAGSLDQLSGCLLLFRKYLDLLHRELLPWELLPIQACWLVLVRSRSGLTWEDIRVGSTVWFWPSGLLGRGVRVAANLNSSCQFRNVQIGGDSESLCGL